MTVQEFATMSALEDAAKLEQFEALVQAQIPATQPWTPVTDYSFEARRAVEGQHPRLIVETFHPRRVIDAGCGRHAILMRLLRELAVSVTGFDPQIPVRGIRHLTSALTSGALHASVTDDDLINEPPWADLVICREVLEHLTILQIRQAVTNLCRLSSKFVYVTTRFARTPRHLLDLDTFDDLDPTHITLLNQNLLRLLFVLEGFRRRADLETQLDWKKLGRCLVYERA